MALHWIFKSGRVQDFIIGEMRDLAMYHDHVVEDDSKALLAYMRDGDPSGLTLGIACRLDEMSEVMSHDPGRRRTIDIIKEAVANEMDAKEAARPRDVGDLHEAMSDVYIELDGEVCEVGQAVLDGVQEVHNHVECDPEKDGGVLLSALATMVMSVAHGKVCYGEGLSPKHRLDRDQWEAVRNAGDQIAELRREDMRRFPILGWTEKKIGRAEWIVVKAVRLMLNPPRLREGEASLLELERLFENWFRGRELMRLEIEAIEGTPGDKAWRKAIDRLTS